MNDLKNALKRMFVGRYGVDELSRFMLLLAAVSVVSAIFTRTYYTHFLNTVLLLGVYIRMMSRNMSARLEENDKYLDIQNSVLGIFSKTAAAKVRNQDYKYFRCPRCCQTIRIPKGKGNISIRCPKCTTQFIRKS